MDEDEPPFTGAIIFCPVCCTQDDAVSWNKNDMTCNNCGTHYDVWLQPKVVAEHAMVG